MKNYASHIDPIFGKADQVSSLLLSLCASERLSVWSGIVLPVDVTVPK